MCVAVQVIVAAGASVAGCAGVQTGAHLRVIIRAFYDLFRLRRKIIASD